MPTSELSNELKAALDAARAAAEVIRGFYQRNVKIEVKEDKTPVTEADVRSEEAIRDLLSKRFPSYGFYGEETGKSDMNAESVWLVDPIDGTKSFVRECPFFSTQIALMRGGRFIIRNSWGKLKFGAQSQFGPGHGTIPYSYIAKYGREFGIAFL